MAPLTTPAARSPRSAGAPRSMRAVRPALLVALVWLVTALPLVTGVAACPLARYAHVTCPGCGMTRAMTLLFHGDLEASLAMHPLAAPTALTQLAFAAMTVFVAYRHGTPFALWSVRAGRASVYAVAGVLALGVFLWIARLFGLFGGPVPV